MPEETQVEAGKTPEAGTEEQTLLSAEAQASGAEEPKQDEAAAKAAEEAAEAEKAPEKYEDFKVPEGVTLDPATADEVKAVAKELNLSQAKAQLLVDKLGPQVAKANAEAFQAQRAKTIEEWTNASRTDKEFGGENLDKNLGGANQVLKTYGSPELVQLLVESGLSNHPEVIRFMVRVRKDVSEDRFVTGDKPAGEQKQVGFKYPNSPAFK